MNTYKNPIILSDYSDPDVIRHNGDFFMIASSFNHTPGIPILHSKNLVDWKLINYVFDALPFDKFDKVIHGGGAWAPSIRFNKGLYYAIIPFIDDGIYISCAKDPKGTWSKPWCLIKGAGIEDPCPIWVKDKCYLVVGFAKSRIGFNSMLGVYEVTPDLKEMVSDYKIVYDGHNDNPTIEGPKFYQRNDYFYIMAPAGSVKTGWQTCLRSKDIYGPYETKIVLTQGDTLINGPHQGALIDLPNKEYAFIHFQDMDCYGRIIHLEPVKWINDWPICGEVKDELLAGTPVSVGNYLVDIKSNYQITGNDSFKGNKLSLIWQTPANKKDNWYKQNNGLILNCVFTSEESYNALNKTPNVFLQKLIYKDFLINTNFDYHLEDGDYTGITVMGSSYSLFGVMNEKGKNYTFIKKGSFAEPKDEIIYKEIIEDNNASLKIKYTYPNKYCYYLNGKKLPFEFIATRGRWIGTKIGIFAVGKKNSKGFAKFNYFKHRKLGD